MFKTEPLLGFELNGLEKYVRRLYIATAQYSSLCVGAVVLTLGGDDIEDGVPDREQVVVGEMGDDPNATWKKQI